MGSSAVHKKHKRNRQRASTLAARALAIVVVVAVLVLFRSPSPTAAMDRGHTNPSKAFAMTLAAGSSTAIGALMVLCVTKLDPRLLAATMAFSSGVMLYVSLVEVIQVSYEKFLAEHAPPYAYLFGTLSFFAGALIMAFLNEMVHYMFEIIVSGRKRRDRGRPSGQYAAPHSIEAGHRGSDPGDADGDDGGLLGDSDPSDDETLALQVAFDRNAKEEGYRLLVISAIVGIAIALHNVPEGMATYIASFHSIPAGLPLTFAIAVHNIPEGLAVAMPVFHSTGDRATAIFWASLSGMAEPFGALVAFLFVNPQSSASTFGAMFAISAGMMSYVCLSELLPAAYREFPSSSLVTKSFFAGCVVMASSLVLERFAEYEPSPGDIPMANH